MDLLVAWHDSESGGYSDVLPGELFASEGTLRGATHLVLGPKGGEYIAKCDVVTAQEIVDLDYRPFQNDEDWYLGVMRLTFSDSSRAGLPTSIEWKPQETDTFNPADVTVTAALQPMNAIPIFGSDGEPIHSHFSIDSDGSRILVTLESRGGAIGSTNERNRGYSVGLRLILHRLGIARCRLDDALLASRSASVSEGKRQVEPDGYTLPVALSVLVDETQLGSALQRALSNVASNRKSGSGNTTRRLQLVVTPPTGVSMVALALMLSRGITEGPISEEEVEDASTPLDFDPADDVDARKKTLAAIARRQGQRKFRNSLKDAYSSACAVTGCRVVEVLEAAHIKGFKGPQTNHVQNGLLLRADIHTLFDMGLVGIDVATWKVVLHKSLRAGAYGELHGLPMNLPSKAFQRPSEEALRQHLQQHGLMA